MKVYFRNDFRTSDNLIVFFNFPTNKPVDIYIGVTGVELLKNDLMEIDGYKLLPKYSRHRTFGLKPALSMEQKLKQAIHSEDHLYIEYLLSKGANLNSFASMVYAAQLYEFYDKKNPHFYKFLISKKIDVSITDKNGNTPLHIMCLKAYFSHKLFFNIIQDLVKHNINLNQVNSNGESPFVIALKKRCQLKYIKKFIDIGANPYFSYEGKDIYSFIKNEDDKTELRKFLKEKKLSTVNLKK
jgi:hypothetical protein